MGTLDLLFPVIGGGTVAIDHAYHLFAALSGVVPAFHAPDAGLRVAPLPGTPGPAPHTLALAPTCHLRVRLPQARIADALPLAGRRLQVGEHTLRLGVPSVVPLVPAATLAARLVVVTPDAGPPPRDQPRVRPRGKVPVEYESFVELVRRLLDRQGVAGVATVPTRPAGPRGPGPCRRVVRVKGKTIVGYAVTVSGLGAADSLRLQADGLGGRRRLGCGFFLPVRTGVGL